MAPELASPEALLKADAVAVRLGVRVNRVYELVRHGSLPAVRIGRQIRFDPVALAEWIHRGGQPLGLGGNSEVE